MKISLFRVFCLFTIAALAVSLYTARERTIILHSAATNFNAGIRNQLEADSPEWTNLNGSPPIDVCEVMRVSTGFCANLNRVCNTSGVNQWECLSITLCPLEAPIYGNIEKGMPKKWCYLLRYSRANNKVAETYEVLDAFVLMNGDIIISEGHNAEVEEALKKDLKFSSQARFSESL